MKEENIAENVTTFLFLSLIGIVAAWGYTLFFIEGSIFGLIAGVLNFIIISLFLAYLMKKDNEVTDMDVIVRYTLTEVVETAIEYGLSWEELESALMSEAYFNFENILDLCNAGLLIEIYYSEEIVKLRNKGG